MEDTRTDPPAAADERETLTAFLDLQRQTIEWKCLDLTREQLVQRHVASKTTLLGIVKHLIDVERWWFQAVFAGEPDRPIFWEKNGVIDSEFDIDDNDNPQQLLQMYRHQCEMSNTIVAATPSLDEMARNPERARSLRWILVHMVEETARHAGHADLLRELTDGATGE